MDDDEGDLVTRARAGDLDAYDALIARHQHAALRVAAVVAGSADAEDAVQEALVKAWRALDRFREGSPFRPWLLRIVANEARNRRRGAGRRHALALRLVERPVDGPEERVLAGDDRRRLTEALLSLPDKDRAVLALRYFAELSEADMAIALDCSPGTVKSRLSRAKERLRALLPDTGEVAS